MKVAATTVLVLCAGALAACGTQGVQVPKSSPYYQGAILFREHCSGCHTLSVVGARGSATAINNRARPEGPNFNIRKEQFAQIIYAIHNGGFSGAIMPQNIVVGGQAQAVAEFLAKYSGARAQHVPSTPITLSTK